VDIDWLTASKDERATLYRVTRVISGVTNQSVEAIMEKALGGELFTGADYLTNFRQGKIARAKAKLIYAWIAEHHIDTAHAIEPDLFPMPALSAWERYLDKHAIRGKLRLVRIDKFRGIVQRADSVQPADQRLQLGEEFCFELESKTKGTAIAFQGYRGKWHPLPLGKNGELSTAIIVGTQILPQDTNDQPISLIEMEDTGLHHFVFVIAQKRILKLIPEQFTANPKEKITLHQITVRFES